MFVLLVGMVIGFIQNCSIARCAGADHDDNGQVTRLMGSGGLCASFSSNGAWILTAGNDEARVWDAKTLKPVIDPIRHKNMYFAALSPDGKTVVTCGIGTARLWDAKTGTEVVPPLKHEVPVNGDGVIHMAAFSPDGSMLATACGDGKAHIWSASNGHELLDPIEIDRSGPVLSVAFSPDGKKLLTVARASAQLWDASNGKLFATLHHGTDSTYCAAFSPDGKRVATGHAEGFVVVWDAETGKALVEARKDILTIVWIAFSPDGTRFVTADRYVRVWDALSAKSIIRLGDGVTLKLKAVFSPDGKSVLGGGTGGIHSVWDASTGKELIQLSQCEYMASGAFSPNGNMIAMACYPEGYTSVWSRASDTAK
ncbi:MAG TPA: WD40 repeat domain-containing protein [Tepidisphaeraceae bacterium]|nr:WD40 repeat domain-containing protein [Tepidisphaeraceae bacterium]